VKAICIESHTLIGPDDARPAEYGNCFSVKTEDGGYYNIVNFVYENMEALEKLGLTWPIEIEALDPRTAVIMDARIGERWYSRYYCTVCTPTRLLPINQRQAQLRDIARGILTESDTMIMLDLQKKAQFP
jgi:hypothetical protein